MAPRAVSVGLVALVCAIPARAFAQDDSSTSEREGESEGADRPRRSTFSIPSPRAAWPYARFLGTVVGGTGLRFNNPYRLATPLGDDAESLSRTAAYVDLGLTALFGDPERIQHGPALRVAFAVEGINQQVLSPSYLVCRQWRSVQPCVRAGLPLVLGPDVNAGGELGLGVNYFVRAGVGVMAEGILGIFYGAATRERAYPPYPLLAGQLGLVVSYEVLP